MLRQNRLFSRALLLALTVSLLACNVLHSALTVQPGKQFELGGNQHGAFTVLVQNVGNVSVVISERRADGQHRSLGLFRPGDRQTVQFASGSAALVSNASDKSARLDLVVTGDKNLSMRETQNQ